MPPWILGSTISCHFRKRTPFCPPASKIRIKIVMTKLTDFKLFSRRFSNIHFSFSFLCKVYSVPVGYFPSLAFSKSKKYIISWLEIQSHDVTNLLATFWVEFLVLSFKVPLLSILNALMILFSLLKWFSSDIHPYKIRFSSIKWYQLRAVVKNVERHGRLWTAVSDCLCLSALMIWLSMDKNLKVANIFKKWSQ